MYERTSSLIPSVADDPGLPERCRVSYRLFVCSAASWPPTPVPLDGITAVGGSVLISRFETNARGTTQSRGDAVLVVARRECRTRVYIRICSVAAVLSAMARGSCVGSVEIVVHSHNTTSSGRARRLASPCLAIETRAPERRYTAQVPNHRRLSRDQGRLADVPIPATLALKHQRCAGTSYGWILVHPYILYHWWQAAWGERVSNRDPASGA